MKKILVSALVVGYMVVAASAEVIYVDFNDAAGALTSPETYNTLSTNYTGTGPNHPVATAGGGLGLANLVDTTGAATGAGITLHSYSAFRTAAGSEAASGASVIGVDTNALDGFWLNDQGRGTTDFGFILTFTNLTAEAYNIKLVDGPSNSEGTYSVTIGVGDSDAEPYTASDADVLEWTAVVPLDGTIELRSDGTDGANWRNTVLCFVSLEATEADPEANQAPTADDITETVDEDGSIAITLVGSDPEGDDLTYNLVSQPANGTVTTNGTLPDIIYTPDADFYGDDSFTYTVNDGEYDSLPGTVSITVNPVAGDVPVADDLLASVYQDSSVAITLSGTDPDGNTNLSYTVTTDPSNGSLTGIAPDLTYSPIAGYTGDDSFTYTVNDGESDSAAATVSITVNALVPAGTELIENGDFEQDGYTETGLNNQTAAITNWTGPYANGNLRYDTTADGNLPEQPNTAIRLLYNTSIRQNFSTSWTSNSTFVVNLNACEVWWKAATNQLGNGIFLSLRNATGKEYQAQLIELDGTHGGSGTVYPTWESNQTHSLTFSGADLIAAGAIANEELRLNIFSKSDTDSINWIDNVSVMMTWGDRPVSVGDMSIEIVSGGTEVALSWPTQQGFNYGVAGQADMQFGSWGTAITNNIPGTGGEVTVTIPVSKDVEFYRAYLEE